MVSRILVGMLATLLVALLSIGVKSPRAETVSWSYHGQTGPLNWGRLQPEYASCQEGKSQSPVDIVQTEVSSPQSLLFNYQAHPTAIVNNGHTVQVGVEEGNIVSIDKKPFQLKQLHFHTPSEHRVAGQAYPVEVHLVHQDQDGRIAVIAVFMERGTSNPFIQQLWENLPGTTGENKPLKSIRIPIEQILPADRSSYRYLGSLTTPPCTEGVMWVVLRNPIQASGEQLSGMTAILKNNARPVQNLHGRVVYESR